ncbi:membrane protein [Cytobacillus firmus]|uniref:DUF421 domain-containing protein n=1 Tax=Cytobacillus firmus TaxID=1399 RepID=UPI00077C4FD7|nr:DUF421 domain-containing protein [Cytobacillus firmus]MBG9448530.1 membrane protein [Cytobacillus firmus]MBG9543515.1 membrane protein [Cytobacillus firmus]MBG9554865.1 membrane protein [Cytobacillus firmus]MBG9559561.1 membrane protein [Cytobacillus firmus]MBG9577313.1 membrane protein [Cytobacillus firmus]
MEEYLIIIVRTLFLYAVILLIFRLMGKREIGELSILDLVVYIMIAELAVVAIETPDSNILKNVLPMLLLMVVQIVLAIFSLKSKTFRDVVDGKPTIIINKGKIDENAMRKQRYNFDDLLLQLREKDIAKISDVEFAILESSGTLSVFERNDSKEGGITIPLIIDGTIQKTNLETINKSDFWLRQELRKEGYKEISNISFCSYENGQFYVDLLDERK